MIRFDTFGFDYDTKNVIVFSREVVVLLVRHALLLTSDREITPLPYIPSLLIVQGINIVRHFAFDDLKAHFRCMDFIPSQNRNQLEMTSLESMISQDDPVRLIDAFEKKLE